MADTNQNLTPLEAYAKLKELVVELKTTNNQANELSKKANALKTTAKALMNDIGTDTFEENGVTLSLSKIDKSFLDETKTLEFLKSTGNEELVHTREYFDTTEILGKVQRGEINAEDLIPLKVDKFEIRLNIK